MGARERQAVERKCWKQRAARGLWLQDQSNCKLSSLSQRLTRGLRVPGEEAQVVRREWRHRGAAAAVQGEEQLGAAVLASAQAVGCGPSGCRHGAEGPANCRGN